MCWEINPFRFSFWGSKTACASGGGQFLFLLGLFLDTPVVFVFWSRLRRVTFQRWKVTKDRRACGPGPCVGAKSAPFRFRLKPKTALRSFAPPSPHRTRFAGLRRGPPRGGRRWGLRGLQILWLLPAVLASALNTSAIGPSGGYPPGKT